MSRDFQSARHWARELIEDALFPGARAVDATLGNGHDALWLCERVGEGGLVYGFDVQPEALLRSKERLNAAGLLSRARLFLMGHEHMAEMVKEAVDAIVFNLGWLPGAQHRVTTRAQTTLAAVAQAIDLLRPGGILTVCIYPGHEEGLEERDALLRWAQSIDPRFDVLHRHYLNQPNHPPELLAVRRRS